MQLKRISIVSLFDLQFERLSHSDLKSLTTLATSEELTQAYEASFEWLFYGSSLPRCQRFIFRQERDQHSLGSSLLLNPEHQVGVYSIWHRYEGNNDALKLKRQTWEEDGSYDQSDKIVGLRLLDNLGLSPKRSERLYSLVSILPDTDDLDAFCTNNAEALGRLFTGGYAFERPHILKGYIEDDLSCRQYEKLFVRWTDALAIYSSDREDTQTAFCRAVQVFELCILVRSLLRNISFDADRIAAALRPYKSHKILDSLQRIEQEFVVAPPIQSVEANELLEASYKSFGIPEMISKTRAKCMVLENRAQWSRAQILGGIGIAAYLIDKLGGWKAISGWLQRLW
jgi:hypothetical protein